MNLIRAKITRRSFVSTVSVGVPMTLLGRPAWSAGQAVPREKRDPFLEQWANPPREFSQAPFWFWNDDLSEKEIARQMDDFCAHGIYGFVIHPRAGLPRSIGWMSERMIHFMRFSIEQAVKKDMWVVLYDEGMYPSGSSSGQVVAQNTAHRTRGLFAVDLDNVKSGDKNRGFQIGNDGKPILSEDEFLVAIVKRRKNGHRIAVVDRAIRPGYSLIRGLHFLEEDPPRRSDKKEVPENMPPLADILNPDAVAAFIRLVYQRYYDEFGEHFGKTVKAIFTDEPSFLGKRGEPWAVPGTRRILDHVNAWLGYDFTPYLPALWYKDEPEGDERKEDYQRALQARLEETYYRQISKWCENHGIALTGHPADPDDIGHLRHFHIPGQDIVWRYIEPGKPNALEGGQSTQAKCASSAMIHLGRRRNSNEYCGAYGHNFTFEEMKWLANWLLVRGCNLLYPHAFYYSVRGPRIDERPPDVGPNNVWWNDFKPFADATSRLCWLNTDCLPVCELAILGLNDYLPWQAAKVCYQHQRDFNYLEARHLWEDAKTDKEGIHLAGMHYRALILEIEPPGQARPMLEVLERAGRLIKWQEGNSERELVEEIGRLISPDVKISPHTPDLRVRHVIKHGMHCYLLLNEGEQDITADLAFSTEGEWHVLDAETGEIRMIDENRPLNIPSHAMQIFMVHDS